MASLAEALKARTAKWRTEGFPHDPYGVVAEILTWAEKPDGAGFQLRTPQLRAFETYWYLRLVEQTPRISDLYERVFGDDTVSLLDALGVPEAAFRASNYQLQSLWNHIDSNDEFVHLHKLETLRESRLLAYPSYILALAMGAGKTALIGAIVASEFAMAMEFPDGDFVSNALVFAPGTTILGALRELAEIPYERILPPRLFKQFAASTKLIFTRDGEREIPVIKGSAFNIIVTNTEKIRIQKETIRKKDLGTLFSAASEDEARAEVANLRLQAIAGLPNLGVFSDEAHHTYGQALDTELKKVRKTVDYLQAQSPNLICVVNTTGTPYYKRQPLRDVVIWYGLSQGIQDNILKTVGSNIHAYSFDGNPKLVVRQIVTDFFEKYGEVTLPNGSLAKLAIYFPQTDDLQELRPVVEATLAELHLSPGLVLERHSSSGVMERDAFERINEPTFPHRVVLLVNMGTEGWNVPSLFACALVRKLKTSNNFVLQAASRCLRQVPGNTVPASIYLSAENARTLDNELRDTYGESLEELQRQQRKSGSTTIVLRKLQIPPLTVRQHIRTVVRKQKPPSLLLSLTLPPKEDRPQLQRSTFEIARRSATTRLLKQIGDSVTLEASEELVDLYAAANELAAVYRLDDWVVLDELRRLYGDVDEIPLADIVSLSSQLESHFSEHEVINERVERALALIKPDGFVHTLEPNGAETYTAEIRYPLDRERLLANFADWERRSAGKPSPFGFHYSPYNFDSNPELSFFETLYEHIGLHPHEVEDIYFTGALTDPSKSDFFVEYAGRDGRWHRYTPDFIIRRKDGRCLIVEIKAERDRDDPIDGQSGAKALAVTQWASLNPDQLRYQIIFVREDVLTEHNSSAARQFVEGHDA